MSVAFPIVTPQSQTPALVIAPVYEVTSTDVTNEKAVIITADAALSTSTTQVWVGGISIVLGQDATFTPSTSELNWSAGALKNRIAAGMAIQTVYKPKAN